MLRTVGVFVMDKKKHRKALSVLLMLAIMLIDGAFLVPEAAAAQVGIDTTVNTTAARQVALGSSVVFLNDTVGYKFYVDSTGVCVYSKTTNGGTSWGSAVVIDAQTDCFGVTVWYDRWTPGDRGNFIHILTADTGNDQLWYNRVDIRDDTRLMGTAPVNVSVNTAQTGTISSGSNTGSITKGTDGTLYFVMNDNTDSYVVECSTACNLTTSWTETGINPMDLQPDWSKLLPLPGGNIILINRDISADTLRSRVWNNTTSSWGTGWTTIGTLTRENATYDPQFSATVDIRNGDIYLAYIDMGTVDGAIGGNNDSIRTARYSAGTWSARTNVVTSVTANPAGLLEVSVGIDSNTGNVYVAYTGRTVAATATTGQVYYRVSTNGMTSWGAQNGPLNTVGASDVFGLNLNAMSDERLFLTWYGVGALTLWGDTLANLEPATVLDIVGSQVSELSASTTNQYLGGTLRITERSASRSVTSITLSESGSINAAEDIENVRLLYDTDTSAPYDCSSEFYNGTEPQFGSTATTGFSSPGERATFTGTATISPTAALCLYVVTDVKRSARTKSVLLSIESPYEDVLVSGGGLVRPISRVAFAAPTNIVDANLAVTNYHWRNDNGNETGATSRTNGQQNIATVIQQRTPLRLRVGISNAGGATSSVPATFRLEYAENLTTCSAVTSWTDVGAADDAWNMSSSTFITDGDNTTDIAVSSGGVANVGTAFLATNGGLRDTQSQTGILSLAPNEFTELEFSIVPAASIVENTSYCFRVTAAGEPFPVYTNYPQATVKLSNDFRIQRGVTDIPAGATTATITAGVQYQPLNNPGGAFIRITNTQITGGGPTTGAGTRNANSVMAYISNPNNLGTSITFTRSAATLDSRVYWEIIEYQGVPGGDNEIIVRDARVQTYTTGSAVQTGTVVPGIVNDADVAVFITGQGNPNNNTTTYVSGLSTAEWDAANNRPVLRRNQTSGASPVSLAVVEFTGSNWRIQRVEHTYAAVGATETQAMNPVNSLSRTFIHTQKRASVNTHANFSHEVWLSSIGQVSFLLDANATTPTGQTSVAWVIENTQTAGAPMIVTRSNGSFNTIGTSPQTNIVSIGKTLADVSIASIFVNNRSNQSTATWPEPIMGARIISPTEYELWRSDISSNINYRTEIVEWPTAVRQLEQRTYRLYVDNGALTPTDPWPAGPGNLGENEEMTGEDDPTAQGDRVRIRMSLRVTGSSMAVGSDSFRLEYGRRTAQSCSAVSEWLPLGEVGSTTAAWRGFDNAPPDGARLSPVDPPAPGALLLTGSVVSGRYEEQNNSEGNPFIVLPGEVIEYDWVVEHNEADDKTTYCFRMVEAGGAQLSTYSTYPVLRTVGYEPLITNWRWYDDEASLTPAVPRAGENVTPSNIENQNTVKLRVVLRESSGADGVNAKFAVQYSEYADFSRDVFTAASIEDCTDNSRWCYAAGAGSNNAPITASVISNADSCISGVGNGCGTHNTSTSTLGLSTTHVAYSNAEYEFTLKQAGARVNAVYYFRLYNITADEVVGVASTFSAPSVVTEGAALELSFAGVSSGTILAGVTTNVDTSPFSIPFGSLSLGAGSVAAQQISVDTNATEGYQLLAYYRQALQNTYGDSIPNIQSSNSIPLAWNTACNLTVQSGCFGYHTTDATLSQGSTRFAPSDSYAPLETTPREILASSIPASDTEHVIFRVAVTENQPAGQYVTDIVYIAVSTY